MNDSRTQLITMGFDPVEVDRFLEGCAADSAAFDAWWSTLSRQEQVSINDEVRELVEAAFAAGHEDRQAEAEKTVYQRHGFVFPYGMPCPALSEDQKARYLELITDDTVMLGQVTEVPFKRKG